MKATLNFWNLEAQYYSLHLWSKWSCKVYLSIVKRQLKKKKSLVFVLLNKSTNPWCQHVFWRGENWDYFTGFHPAKAEIHYWTWSLSNYLWKMHVWGKRTLAGAPLQGINHSCWKTSSLEVHSYGKHLRHYWWGWDLSWSHILQKSLKALEQTVMNAGPQPLCS